MGILKFKNLSGQWEIAEMPSAVKYTEQKLSDEQKLQARLNIGITDISNTVLSNNADYAEIGEWADGNPNNEKRIGYFIAIQEVTDNTVKIRKATSTDDVRGVTVYNPAFSGNASSDKFDSEGLLLPAYNYVALLGVVSVIDNGTCSVNGRCIAADDGTAVPSDNDYGYSVLKRVDSTHVLIAIEPNSDRLQRIKTEVDANSTSYKESIISLSVNGRTVTYTKGDGSTHSFETQDTDTTYSLGTDLVTGLTKLYATVGYAEDGTMTQKAITEALNTKVGVSFDEANSTLIFTV